MTDEGDYGPRSCPLRLGEPSLGSGVTGGVSGS